MGNIWPRSSAALYQVRRTWNILRLAEPLRERRAKLCTYILGMYANMYVRTRLRYIFSLKNYIVHYCNWVGA